MLPREYPPEAPWPAPDEGKADAAAANPCPLLKGPSELPLTLGPEPVSDRGTGRADDEADNEPAIAPPASPALGAGPEALEEKSTSSLSPTMSRPFLCLPRTTERLCRLPAPDPAEASAAAIALLALAPLLLSRHPPPPPPRVALLPVLVLLEVESKRRSSCPPLVPALLDAGRLPLKFKPLLLKCAAVIDELAGGGAIRPELELPIRTNAAGGATRPELELPIRTNVAASRPTWPLAGGSKPGATKPFEPVEDIRGEAAPARAAEWEEVTAALLLSPKLFDRALKLVLRCSPEL